LFYELSLFSSASGFCSKIDLLFFTWQLRTSSAFFRSGRRAMDVVGLPLLTLGSSSENMDIAGGLESPSRGECGQNQSPLEGHRESMHLSKTLVVDTRREGSPGKRLPLVNHSRRLNPARAKYKLSRSPPQVRQRPFALWRTGALNQVPFPPTRALTQHLPEKRQAKKYSRPENNSTHAACWPP